MRIVTIAAYLLTATSLAAQSSLPPNYKTIYSNSNVVVMHVHYGAHEFVPMHDHPAVSTIYLYLNNSGPIDIIHEDGVVAHRPPTQLGALRIAPGLAESHSVQSNSDTPSDFLRIELPHIGFPELPEVGKRIPAPLVPEAGVRIDFEDPSLRITRITCPQDKPCDGLVISQRSLLVAVTASIFEEHVLQSGHTVWLAPGNTYQLGPASQFILVTFLQPK